MPYSVSNPPSFAKNKSEKEKEIASQAANAVLNRGGTEEEAIFAAIAQVKNHNKKQSQKKAADSPARVLPSHISALLQKVVVEPVKPSNEGSVKNIGIRKEFLGKNALPVDTDRNLVSVELLDNFELVHTFDTGEKIRTDLSKLKQTVENYVSISSGSKTQTKVLTVNTVADTPLIVNHNLELEDPDAIIVSFILNGRVVDVDCQILDGNSIEILTYVDTMNLRINLIGI